MSAKWFMCISIITPLIVAVGCYAWFDDQKEGSRNLQFWRYIIDTETIINELDRGNTNIFTLIETTPEATSVTRSELVSWSQDDFLRIAQTLHQNLWQIPLDENTLYNLKFDMDCSNVEQGTFDIVVFDTYQVIQVNKEETRIERSISIFPSRNEVRATSLEHYPSLGVYESLDLTKYRVSVQKALQIAEENGGREQRLKYGNACSIMSFAPGPDGKGWRVMYRNINNNTERYFDIEINPQTGEFEVKYSK